MLYIISYSRTALHGRTRIQLLKESQLSTPGGCRYNQADELRFVFLSWKPPSSKKTPLSHWEKKESSEGEKVSFNFCWGINWAFRWAEQPWIRKDGGKKNQSGERKVCSHLPGCGEVERGNRKISKGFSGTFTCPSVATCSSKQQPTEPDAAEGADAQLLNFI